MKMRIISADWKFFSIFLMTSFGYDWAHCDIPSVRVPVSNGSTASLLSVLNHPSCEDLPPAADTNYSSSLFTLLSLFFFFFFFVFLVAPSLLAERLIWSLWHVSVWLVVCISQRDPPPPWNHQISKIPKPKCVSAHSEQLFWGGLPPPPQKREKFLTPDLAWYMFRLEKKFFAKKFHRISWTIS